MSPQHGCLGNNQILYHIDLVHCCVAVNLSHILRKGQHHLILRLILHRLILYTIQNNGEWMHMIMVKAELFIWTVLVYMAP